MKAIVMAAGDGKRMWPLTETRPKALLPVVGKPIVYHQISAMKRAGIEEFIFIVREKREILEKYLNELQDELKVKIEFVEQGPENGTAAALLSADGKVNEKFLVVGGDLLYDSEIIKKVISEHSGEITVGLKKVERPEKYGVVETADGKISYLEEKPRNPRNNLVNISVYCMEPAVFEKLKNLKKSERDEYELTDILVGAKAVEVEGYWEDVGYPWNLLDANKEFLKRMESDVGEIENSSINGKVYMEKGAKIIGSHIEGDVYIGKNTIIGPNAYIKGPASIGDNCNIGDSVTVKQSVIFDNVNAKHLAYIGDSIVGNGVNFGSGTQLANFRFDSGTVNVLTEKGWVNSGRKKLGAIIGDNVKFGVLSSTMPGKLIGANAWIHSGVIVNKNVPSNVYVYIKQEIHFKDIEG